MKVLVIGGGPAGMMAAIAAAEQGADVTIAEGNEKLGKKLFLSGKGRCNVTNAAGTEDHFRQIVRNPRFLYSALRHFDNRAVMAFLESNGVPLKVERGDRVFPESDKSSDVIRAFARRIGALGIAVWLDTKVDSLRIEEGRAVGAIVRGQPFDADAVVLATGGASYPRTGSTGDGYAFARAVGHDIRPSQPALVPLIAREAWVKDLQGLTLKNVVLRAYQVAKSPRKGREAETLVYEELGEMLFTHFGISGPLVLSASSHLDPEGGAIRLAIDLKPGLRAEQLDARLQRDFSEASRKIFANALGGLLPSRLCDAAVALSDIPPQTPVHQISRPQRLALGALLKAFPIAIDGFRPIDEAIVTRGGIDVKQVNPSTMESKICAGLYFAGEVLDVDAMTGGFNLQVAFSTGHLAGTSAATASKRGNTL